MENIIRILRRRPPMGRFREQLFWLVDLIYACKASGHNALAAEAQLVEDALGLLGEYLETGDHGCLNTATSRVEQFAAQVRKALVPKDKDGE